MSSTGILGRRIAIGYAIAVLCVTLVSAVAIYTLHEVIATNDVVRLHTENMIDGENLEAAALLQSAGFCGFLLTGNESFAEEMQSGQARFRQIFATLRSHVATRAGKELLVQLDQKEQSFTSSTDQLADQRRHGSTGDPLIRLFLNDTFPKRQQVERVLSAFSEHERQLVLDSKAAATRAENQATYIDVAITLAAVVVAVLLTVLLTRNLGRSISSAIQGVQNSAAQLQSTANQQSSTSKQHATVMTEITTTITELLATARQIAERAQQVGNAAREGSSAAHHGEQVVNTAQSAMGGIKHQFEQNIERMLDLGKKSQQIGGILDIVNELAEQTNILAINAAIEATGVGESGRRFGTVADEIRKLADRVSGSTKEIRDLINQIRAAVDSTVMATEGTSKAVEAGTHEVSEVASAFSRFAELAETAAQAAQEIELSTKQQSSAVDQVHTAVSEVSKGAKELEAAWTQTVQTSSQLSTVSRDLSRLIELQVNA